MAKKEGKILIIDDDPEVLLSGRLLLKRHFGIVQTERDPRKIPKILEQESYDVVLLDMNFSPGNTDGDEGVKWLHKISVLAPETPVIMITAYGHVDMAVRAMKEGATDFVPNPGRMKSSLATVKNTFRLSRSKQEVRQLQMKQKVLTEDAEQQMGELVVGSSPAMEKIYHTIKKVAGTEADVLILGENGTGKELVAREIHRQSNRNQEVFIKVDLGAISETLFESELFGHQKGAFTDAHEDRQGRIEVASGGTLFLDEIGNLSPALQAKLLTVLQNRSIIRVGSNRQIPIDIRLVCATNKPLYDMVKEGTFRQDLLYRMNTVEIQLPPLRERTEDIPTLAEHFLAQNARKYQKGGLKFAANTLKKLQKYRWPGNIRELRHAIERSVIMSEESVLKPNDFQFHGMGEQAEESNPDSYNLEEMEKMLIRKAITHHQGNISKAAKDLGITRAALYRRMEKYGL
ncbi:MAG: sigma-54 dependent transcriptional regulator [Bacteroidia bacterium]